MSRRNALWVVLTGSCAALAGGCVEEQRYAIENQSVALTENTAPAFVTDDDDEIFIVTRAFELPISPPKNSDMSKLMRTQAEPFPRAPWVDHNDLELQLDYTLANQGDTEVLAGIILNGQNEFNLYTPGPLDFNQWERSFALGPKERVHGTVTELEMDEIAVDLATVVNGAPNSNQVVQFQSQSGRDPRVREFIPKRVPGLVGITAGIMTTAAANVVLEISVRVQDHGDRLAKRGQKAWMLPEPEPFVPVVIEDDE